MAELTIGTITTIVCIIWRVLLVCDPLASCVLCILFVASCVGMFLGKVFFACTFMLSRVLQHSAKIEVCLMEAHSVQQSAVETVTLKFCLLHCEL